MNVSVVVHIHVSMDQFHGKTLSA